MGYCFGAGHSADITVVAKDAKGFQKSLGGDIFTVSWLRNGQDDEPATHGKLIDTATTHRFGLCQSLHITSLLGITRWKFPRGSHAYLQHRGY